MLCDCIRLFQRMVVYAFICSNGCLGFIVVIRFLYSCVFTEEKLQFPPSSELWVTPVFLQSGSGRQKLTPWR